MSLNLEQATLEILAACPTCGHHSAMYAAANCKNQDHRLLRGALEYDAEEESTEIAALKVEIRDLTEDLSRLKEKGITVLQGSMAAAMNLKEKIDPLYGELGDFKRKLSDCEDFLQELREKE